MGRKSNADFGDVLAPLMKPVYVLQMARSKEWPHESRLRALMRMRVALRQSLEVCEVLIANAQRHVNKGP